MSGAHNPSSPDAPRFAFGKNWQRFLNHLDEDRIAAATCSLQTNLHCENLNGRSFLDVGCGSGLFSLAARRLGARVHSFDFDEQSVACCEELKRRDFPLPSGKGQGEGWRIERGSILDTDYLKTLPAFDVVYAWGVLHHTGDMWQALANVDPLVAKGGTLCLAIYNDEGGPTRRWHAIKRLYAASPAPIRWLLILAIGGYTEARQMLIRLLRLQNPLPFADWARHKEARGMSPWHDLIDWVGGYPFEAAKPEQIFNFFKGRHYTLTHLTTQTRGHGCNEFTFLKNLA